MDVAVRLVYLSPQVHQTASQTSGPLRVVKRVVVALRLVVTGGLLLPRRRLVAALRSTVPGNLNSVQALQR